MRGKQENQENDEIPQNLKFKMNNKEKNKKKSWMEVKAGDEDNFDWLSFCVLATVQQSKNERNNIIIIFGGDVTIITWW